MYIYKCDKFRSGIKGQPQLQIVEDKLNQIKARDAFVGLGQVDAYNNGIYVLKVMGTNTCRVIMQLENVDIEDASIPVLFIRDFIEKSGFDFKWPRIQTQISNRQWLENNPLSITDKDGAILRIKRDLEDKPSQLPELPRPYMDWLPKFKFVANDKKIGFDIYEEQAWVDYANDGSVSGLQNIYIEHFRLTLQAIIKHNHTSINITEIKPNLFTAVHQESATGILYTVFNDIYIIKNGAHTERQQTRWREIVATKNTLYQSLEQLSKNTVRAYPKIMLNNIDLWQAVQQRGSNKSNLSLMPEQIDFLDNFTFPHYINGQAGSGKSTMLSYLFANAFYYKYFEEIPGDILFVTENDNLLENTEKTVFDLLTYNSLFDGGQIQDRLTVKNCFKTFKYILLDLLSQEERSKYEESKYLDFGKFKERFDSNHAFRNIGISAEVAWFVIITYIIGYETGRVIDTFEEIPGKFRMVDTDTFNTVYNRIFPFYTRLLSEESYWNKLTLIEYILKNNLIKTKYTLIVCDEAQDFCRVELSFILQLSNYYYYLPTAGIQTPFPVVFAGDALQTVNPTGFSITRLTTMFIDEIEKKRYHIPKIDNKHNVIFTPKYNYRSVEPIVSLANLIQVYRHQTLGTEATEPQEAKRKAFNGRNQHYAFNRDWIKVQAQNEFVRKFEHKLFILPQDTLAQENNDTILGSFKNIKTAVDTKGVEYYEVVIYNFGKYYVENFGELTQRNIDRDKFSRQFFFNKLYVAITRAQNELTIIDSKEGIEQFWKPLLAENKDLIVFDADTFSNISQSTPENARLDAQRDKEQGIIDKNAIRLTVASDVFFFIGEEKEGYDCKAWASKIKKDYKQAAIDFEKAENYEEAAKCYYEAKDWNGFRKMSNYLKGDSNTIRVLIVRFMQYGVWENNEINTLFSLRESLNEQIRETSWRKEFLEKLVQFTQEKQQTIENRRDLISILELLPNENDFFVWKSIGQLYYDTAQYQRAVDAWDKMESSETERYNERQNYLKAKLELSKETADYENWLINLSKLINISNENLYKEQFLRLYGERIETIKTYSTYPFIVEIALGLYIEKNNVSNIIENAALYEQSVEGKQSKQNFYFQQIDNSSHNEALSVFTQERWLYWFLENHNINRNESDENKRKTILDEINTNFQHNNFPRWTWREVIDVPNTPAFLPDAPPPHWQEVIIQNFKQFKTLKLREMGNFNLILGDNNVGKTGLLEALCFSHQPDEFLRNLLYLNGLRMGHFEREKGKENPIKPFINNSSQERVLSFTIINGRRKWNYVIQASNNDEQIQIKYNTDIQKSDDATILNNKLNANFAETVSVIPFVPFGKGYSKELAEIYQKNIGIKRNVRKDFTEKLQLFIPTIEEINTDGEDTIYIVEENDTSENGTPLHLYGEGANKLFRILMAIYLNKNGRLMIDEIDAGIHISRFEAFWRIIMDTAKSLNVQIFATTHNFECIELFTQILAEEREEYQQLSRIITLEEIGKDKILAITRPFNEFQHAIEYGRNLRGGKAV